MADKMLYAGSGYFLAAALRNLQYFLEANYQPWSHSLNYLVGVGIPILVCILLYFHEKWLD